MEVLKALNCVVEFVVVVSFIDATPIVCLFVHQGTWRFLIKIRFPLWKQWLVATFFYFYSSRFTFLSENRREKKKKKDLRMVEMSS